MQVRAVLLRDEAGAGEKEEKPSDPSLATPTISSLRSSFACTSLHVANICGKFSPPRPPRKRADQVGDSVVDRLAAHRLSQRSNMSRGNSKLRRCSICRERQKLKRSICDSCIAKEAVRLPADDGNHRRRLYRYDLTPNEYRHLYLNQHGSCAICDEPTAQATDLVVDHNHGSGEVRGLLCNRCNLGLGHFQDDPEKLARAIRYLSNPPMIRYRAATRQSR